MVKTYKSGAWEYVLLEDDTADITAYANTKATSVELPETLAGHSVSISSENPFNQCDALD